MRVLISTPCSGGMLTDGYTASLVSTIGYMKCNHPDFEIDIHFQGKESLIHRGRNRAAKTMIDGNYDKLISIDADVVFTPEDFRRIILSDKDIVGGVYPIKTFPVVMNCNPLHEKGTELFSTNRGLDYDAWTKFVHKYADKDSGLVEVRHLPTGFMCIKRDVFAKLSHTVEVYGEFDSSSGQRGAYYHFYPSQVKDGSLLSEDWYFCELARDAGFKVYLDTRVILGHIGSHVYRLGQFYGQSERQ